MVDNVEVNEPTPEQLGYSDPSEFDFEDEYEGADSSEVEYNGADSSEVETPGKEGEKKSTQSASEILNELKGSKLSLSFGGASNSTPVKSSLSGLSADVIGSLISEHDDSRLNEAYIDLGNGTILQGEDWGIWRVIYAMRAQSFLPDREFISGFLNRNRSLIYRANGKNINLGDYKPVAGDDIAGYIAAVVERYDSLYPRYLNQTIDDYHKALTVYRMQYARIKTAELYQKALDISNDGLKVGRKYLQGVKDSYAYIREGMTSILSATSDSEEVTRISMRDLYLDMESGDTESSYKICDFVGIPTLNKVWGGLWTGNLYTILAPAKSGKTRFCARLVHSAIMAGKNVTVWAPEGGKEEWCAHLRAIHYHFFHNEGKSADEWVPRLDMLTVLNKTYINDAQRKYEKLSASDLFNNESYGSVDFVEGAFEVSTFIDKIKASVKHNNSSLVVIDYMGWLQSDQGLSEAEWRVLKKGYVDLALYVSSANVAVVSPAQFNQETVNWLLKSGADGSDLRTSGSGTSEIIRASDMIMGLWASTTDLENNQMKIVSVPSRKAPPFENIDLRIDLGTCTFTEVESKGAQD